MPENDEVTLSSFADLCIAHLWPGDRERVTRWAKRIAQADNRRRVSVADILAAASCAGEEFLPLLSEGEGNR